MQFFLAIIVWLAINYLFWGFDFNTSLCFFVGIFLIMPILLKISFNDIRYIFSNKNILTWDIIINFVIIPLLAFAIGYFIFWLENYPFIIALILIGLIPWWGLLMSWLVHTRANLHIGFSLLAINLFLFSFVYIFFNLWVDFFVKKIEERQKIENQLNLQTKKLFSNPYSQLGVNLQDNKKSWWCIIEQATHSLWIDNFSCFKNNETATYWFFGFIALILIPFILSRIILKFFRNKNILKYASLVSKVSAFILISYIFSLGYMRKIFQVDLSLILKISLALIIFYIALFFILVFITKNLLNTPEDIQKAIFWNSFTRFLTLSLILTFLYAISWNKPEIILVPVLAYIIQISFASFYAYLTARK
jgi:hypothetical protein